MPNLVTNRFKIHNAEQFVESLSETSATNLFVFVGRVETWSDDSDPPAPSDSISNTSFDYFKSMIAAKKVTSGDVSHITPRVNWESNTNYTAYTHQNSDLFANNYYAVTEDFNVYKCLQNNLSNGASTIQPTGVGLSIIELSDGYKWKYMYSISPQDILKFTTSSYIPVKKVGNTDDGSIQFDIEQGAVDGSIEIINRNSNGDFRVEFTGSPTDAIGADANFVVGEKLTGQTSGSEGDVVSAVAGANNINYYPNGNTLFTNTEIIVGETSGARATLSQSVFSNYKFEENTFSSVTNSTTLQLATDANSSTDSLYVNSTLYIVNNAGRGEQSLITAYDSSLRRVTVANAFVTTPNTSSGYQISPTITISGDGTLAKARALGNSTFGVKEVIVTNKGKDYTSATITVTANSSHGSGANAIAIISPPGGHGNNAIEELGGNRILIDSRINGNESGYFTTENEYRQIGLVRDPLQGANANAFYTSDLADQATKLTIEKVSGSFSADEIVFQGSSLADSSANGYLIDFLNNNKIRLNRVEGAFVSNSTVNSITGSTSGATASIVANGVANADMKLYSGDILYIENREKVTRLQNQIEDIKIVLEF